ncbi:MAG: hypothetical protein R3C61_17240 [Bacteroidia bacterium]
MPNNWSGLTLDEGIVYIPTGSAASDFWGGDRKKAKTCLPAALSPSTPIPANVYSITRPYTTTSGTETCPAPPTLVTVTHNGKKRDAIAQITKSAFVFVLDRKPANHFFPLTKNHFPSQIFLARKHQPTQPIPQKPEPFARQTFPETDINPYSKDKDSLLAILKNQ